MIAQVDHWNFSNWPKSCWLHCHNDYFFKMLLQDHWNRFLPGQTSFPPDQNLDFIGLFLRNSVLCGFRSLSMIIFWLGYLHFEKVISQLSNQSTKNLLGILAGSYLWSRAIYVLSWWSYANVQWHFQRLSYSKAMMNIHY